MFSSNLSSFLVSDSLNGIRMCTEPSRFSFCFPKMRFEQKTRISFFVLILTNEIWQAIFDSRFPFLFQQTRIGKRISNLGFRSYYNRRDSGRGIHIWFLVLIRRNQISISTIFLPLNLFSFYHKSFKRLISSAFRFV